MAARRVYAEGPSDPGGDGDTAPDLVVEVREVVVVVDLTDVDGGRQPLVGDRDEAVLALEFLGDRLDQRVLLEAVLDLHADRLDELEELVGVHLLLAHEEQVGEDVVVAFAKLVKEHF